jgi:DNA-binding CsgD family transcriptional regulator
MDSNERTIAAETLPMGAVGPEPPGIATFEIRGERFAVLSVPLWDAGALDALTTAEREVAFFAAAGMTNASIARTRNTSSRTTANQMASILSKMRVGSRYGLVARLALCPCDRVGHDG